MARVTSILLFVSFLLSTALSLKKFFVSSNVKCVDVSRTKLRAIWDLNLQRLGKGSRNLQDDDSEVPVLPTSGEEIASKGAKKTFLKGPGVDERSCTSGNGPFSEDDLDTLPRLFKYHKQLTLLSQLEGKQWGGIEKMQRLKLAHLEGILPNDYVSNTIRCTTVKDRKLLDEWNFDMNA